MNNYDILYKYYLALNVESREEARIMLEDRKFNALDRDNSYWIHKKSKTRELETNLLSDVIKELSSITLEPNESEPRIVSYFDEEKEDTYIALCSYLYTIVDYKKCENIARSSAENSEWKIRNQPNGKDSLAALKIINKYLNKDEKE